MRTAIAIGEYEALIGRLFVPRYCAKPGFSCADVARELGLRILLPSELRREIPADTKAAIDSGERGETPALAK